MSDDNILNIELDGPGVSPSSVDTLRTLALAHSFFSLVERTSAEVMDSDVALVFSGIIVVDKCVQIGARVNDMEAAQEAAEEAGGFVSGLRTPPQALVPMINAVRDAIRALPRQYVGSVIAGPWCSKLEAPREDDEPASSLGIEQTTIRAKIVRVGGSAPKARLESMSEVQKFSLDLTKSQATDLGHYIYKQIDAVVRIKRDGLGKIVSGKLLDFNPIEDATPDKVIEELRSFHREVGSQWDDIEDVEGTLRR